VAAPRDCPAGLLPAGLLPAGLLPAGTEYDYMCMGVKKRHEIWRGVMALVSYDNDGFFTADHEWNHCQSYKTADDTYRRKRVSAQLTSTQRPDTMSSFTLTPSSNSIDWSVFDAEHVPDPALEPVTVRLKNFQDGSPLVISDIILRDHVGQPVDYISEENITVVGDEGAKRSSGLSCPISNTVLMENCKDFDGPCCGHNPNYTQKSWGCIVGTILSHTTYAKPLSGVDQNPCNDLCNDDSNCVGYEISSHSRDTEECTLYNKVTKVTPVTECRSTIRGRFASYIISFVALTQSTRLPPVVTLVSAHNRITEEVFDCNHDRVRVNVEFGGRVYNWCDVSISTSFPLPNLPPPPTHINVDSYATVEFQVDGRKVEYIDIGVGATVGDDPSSYTYELIHHGIVINKGVFSSTNEGVNRRSILVKNAGDSNTNELFSKQYLSEFLNMYDMFCNEDTPEHWYGSHTVQTILLYGGTLVSDLCLDLDGSYSTRNPSLFNDAVYAFKNDLEQSLNSLTFLDGTKKSFMKYETSNSNFPPSVDTVKAAIDFLVALGKMFDCGNTTEMINLEIFDTAYLAETLMLEYMFPSRYRSWCDNAKFAEGMRYKKKVYNVGRAGAPCISNAMCHDNFVCADYYCSPSNVTQQSICPSSTTTIHPLYYGLKPKDMKSFACAHSEVYDDSGLGSYSIQEGIPGKDAKTPYGAPLSGFIEYDHYFTNQCPSLQYPQDFLRDDYVRVHLDHFRNRGSYQGCGNYFTSEVTDVGVGIQKGEYGNVAQCSQPTYRNIVNDADSKSGEYDRLVPRKVSIENRDIDYFRSNLGENGKRVLPASFALRSGEEMGLLADYLDAQCFYPDVDELSFTGVGVNNELQCGNVEGCVWSDSLRQCVASRLNVEANFCPLVTSEDQCLLTGFCAWNRIAKHARAFDFLKGAEGECYHPSGQDFVFDSRRNKENECKIIFDPVMCGYSSCIWDMVQETCTHDWTDVVVYNDELFNSVVEGSSDSLNSPGIRTYNGEKKTIGDMHFWPACSAPGKLFLGHQLEWEWMYYPEPAENTFVASYDHDLISIGMRYYTGWSTMGGFFRDGEKDTITGYTGPQGTLYEAWNQRSVQRDGASTNKLCFKKDILYDEVRCRGYGFKWSQVNNLCWFDDDGHIPGVDGLVSIAAPIFSWEPSRLYTIFGGTREKDWDDMVDDRFDENDWENIKIRKEMTYHGYPFLKMGCYTRLTKGHCENTWGANETIRDPWMFDDHRCLWLPIVERCIPRSSKTHNLYNSIYKMPKREQDYNSTITTGPPGGG
jgi:hypothetical protein